MNNNNVFNKVTEGFNLITTRDGNTSYSGTITKFSILGVLSASELLTYTDRVNWTLMDISHYDLMEWYVFTIDDKLLLVSTDILIGDIVPAELVKSGLFKGITTRICKKLDTPGKIRSLTVNEWNNLMVKYVLNDGITSKYNIGTLLNTEDNENPMVVNDLNDVTVMNNIPLDVSNPSNGWRPVIEFKM